MAITKKVMVLLVIICLFPALFCALERAKTKNQIEIERLRKIVNSDAQWNALTDEQQNNYLADLALLEMEEDAQAQEETRALKKSREELERALAADKNINQLFEKNIIEYKNGNPIIIEYLSSGTLQRLLAYAQEKNDTAEAAKIGKHYDLGLNAVTEFVIKFTAAIQAELENRKKLPGTDFKSLIIKGLGKPPYSVDFETFQGLQNKLKAIDILQNDQREKELWAQERNVNAGQIAQALSNIKEPLVKMSISVKEQVLKDLDAAEAEKKAEQQARENIIQTLREASKVKEYQLKVETVKKTYPQFFKGIPYNLEVDFLKKFEELYGGKGKDINQVLTNLYLDPRSNSLTNRLLALGNVLNFNSYAAGGYVFFDNEGKRTPSSGWVLPKLLTIDDRDNNQLQKKVAQASQELVKTYKIHLMPDETIDATEILERFNKALKTDRELSSVIQTFKILYNPTKQGNVNFARVVIYANGKEQAQKILDALYKNPSIKEMKGSNIRPRYNGRVNDLLWIAQGDGDYKDGIYKGYYEQPALIYYNQGITGKRENYHLANPETKQEVIT